MPDERDARPGSGRDASQQRNHAGALQGEGRRRVGEGQLVVADLLHPRPRRDTAPTRRVLVHDLDDVFAVHAGCARTCQRISFGGQASKVGGAVS